MLSVLTPPFPSPLPAAEKPHSSDAPAEPRTTVIPTPRRRPAAPIRSASRIVQNFDFDERRLGNPEDLPMHWSKVEGPGLPHYVSGRLDNSMGRSTSWSFRFDLNGGSLVYRFDPAGGGRIPVVPGSTYRIDGFVRTTALENARGRVSVYFVDQDFHPIPNTVRHSSLVGSATASPADPWTPVSVSISADDPNAAYLVIELGLVQPAIYATAALGDRTLFKQDFTGSAWFTDLTVSQIPQVEVYPDQPGGIFPRGMPVRLHAKITDRLAADLTLNVQVVSANGNLVYQRTGPLDVPSSPAVPRPDAEGPQLSQLIEVPEQPPGWYLMRLVLTAQGREVARELRSFVCLADQGAPVPADGRFGVVATQLSPTDWESLPKTLPLLGMGRVKVAVWAPSTDILKSDSEPFDLLLSDLRDSGILTTACLTALPPELARTADSASLARIPAIEEQVFKPRLSYLIARHANHIDRWQLGTDGQEDFALDPAFRRAYDRTYATFAELIHDPDLAIPWSAVYEPDPKLPSTVAVSVPTSILPEQIPLYVQETRQTGARGAQTLAEQRFSVSLLALDNRYGREARLRDFAQRIVATASAGAPRIDLPYPFTAAGQPDELFPIIRTLLQSIGGATFRGRVALTDTCDAYLFDRGGTGVLVLWNKSVPPLPPAPSGSAAADTTPAGIIPINLGGQPRMIDLFGNITRLRPVPAPPASSGTTPNSVNTLAPLPYDKGPEPGSVLVPLPPSGLPVIVENIDPALALFRASVKLNNENLESSFVPHNRKLTFTNTFPDAINGVCRITAPEGWSVTPSVLPVNVNAGETFSKDIAIQLPYNTTAGVKPLKVTFSLPGTVAGSFTMPVSARVGLQDVGLQSVAVREGNDILVQLLVSNYGTRPINYTAFTLYPGQARQERLVTNLPPGRTTVKRFKFPADNAPPDRKIRVGLREIDGNKILNDELALP